MAEDFVPVARNRVRTRHNSTRVDKEGRTLTRASRGASVPPIDKTDEEVVEAIAEGRAIRMDDAFPDPPAPLPEARSRNFTLQRPSKDIPITARPSQRVPPPVPEDASPSERIYLVDEHSPTYSKEYKLRLLHRLLMRNLPLDVIASQMQVPVSTVKNLRAELHKRLIYETQHINRYQIAGKTMAFYDELTGMALRAADKNARGDKPFVHLQALSIALSAMADRQRFLQASGFWAATPFVTRDDDDTTGSGSTSRLHKLIEMVVDENGNAEDTGREQEEVIEDPDEGMSVL